MSRKNKVFIVDDHPLLRRGYSYLIGREADLQICGEAETVTDALEKIRLSEPDLVVTDITLEGANGLELIKALQTWRAELPVLVVSMHDEALYAARAFRAGARGYVAKKKAEATILIAIRRLLHGGYYLSDEMTDLIMRQMQNGGTERIGDPAEQLTDRELEVFEMCGRGRSTRQISDALHISPKTVETHRIRIKTKLGLNNTSELVQRAVKWVHEHEM